MPQPALLMRPWLSKVLGAPASRLTPHTFRIIGHPGNAGVSPAGLCQSKYLCKISQISFCQYSSISQPPRRRRSQDRKYASLRRLAGRITSCINFRTRYAGQKASSIYEPPRRRRSQDENYAALGVPPARPGSQAMLIPINNIILNAGRKLREVSAEPANANDQIPMIIGMNLGIPQFLGIHHVVLNMRAAV
jgi:hypothetical protein